ncbi:MAG: DUF1963 domain-containing protein [Enterocloster asparagiformis]|nr:DUF1963 domain-containing protein [Enterocloster asparagiformis]
MDLKESLLRMGKNSICLEIAGEAEPRAGGTRFGGAPDVPADFVWPEFETAGLGDDEVRPRPLSFMAQFNCAELAPFDTEKLLPSTGLLSFFYEMDSQPWGFDPGDRGCARVFWFEDTAALAPARFPETLGVDFRFPRVGIAARARESYPGWEDFCTVREVPDEDCDLFDQLQAELGAEEPENCSKLLGWPDVIQNNMTIECELVSRGYYLGGRWDMIPQEELAEARERSLDRWQLLFQLDTVEYGDDFELSFGDSGRLYFYILKEDLAARRFDRVWLILQCF